MDEWSNVQLTPNSSSLLTCSGARIIRIGFLILPRMMKLATSFGKHRTRNDPMPLAVLVDGSVLHDPDEQLLAAKLGLLCGFNEAVTHDVVIVGAGPAGLAAAVYAASEGLPILVFDSK